MNTNIAPVPDLLQRFAPTPHVFNFCRDDVHVRIETNDLNIALGVRKFCMLPTKGKRQTVLLWKLIRDRMAPEGDMEVTILSDGPLRTLLLGTGTMITFDRERHEILGFLAPGVTPEQLAITLIPLLIYTRLGDGRVWPSLNPAIAEDFPDHQSGNQSLWALRRREEFR